MIAALLEYRPADSKVKKQAANLLAEDWNVSDLATDAAQECLRFRRGLRQSKQLSGIVLVGGASSRMGSNKSALPFFDRTLLEWQVAKLRALGIQDIMIAGENCAALSGARVVPDEFPHREPLGGLHTCLLEASSY